MKLYIDTSSLIHSFTEEDEGALQGLMRPGTTPMVSGLVFVELSAYLARALRGRRLRRHAHDSLKDQIRSDLKRFRILPANEELFRQAALVAEQTGLRSLDSIHLASARMGGADRVATRDREMAYAAQLLGFELAF